jgi:predicted amidohydrolase
MTSESSRIACLQFNPIPGQVSENVDKVKGLAQE